MNKTIHLPRHLITFGVPSAIILTMVLLARSTWFDTNSEALSLGITVDLLLTVPLVYYLLIRTTNIPKTTVIPFLGLGVVVGTFILPLEHQYVLDLVKRWVLPVVELSVAGYVFYNVRKAILSFKKQKKQVPDFFTALKDTCYKILPPGVVMPVVTEIAVFYYGFVYWRKRSPQENEFTYYKHSGTVVLLLVLLLLVIAETFVLHILLSLWSNTIAWGLTILSIYSGVQLFGFLKSLSKRPYSLEENQLNLRYGILSEASIDVENIQGIEISSKEIEMDEETRQLSPLGPLESHNTVIRLKDESTLDGLYGTKRKFKTLLLFVDDPEKFKDAVEGAIAGW